MRVECDGPFHVNCAFTKRAVCHCVEGTPEALRDPLAAKAYAAQAQLLWEYWHRPAEALFPGAAGPAAPPAQPAAEAPPRAVSPPPPQLSEEHRALLERVEAARKKATYSAMTAASLAARGGLLYTPPEGVDISKFMEHLETQNHAELEASATEVLRARATRVAAAAAAAAAAPQLPEASALGGGIPVMSGQLMRAASIDAAQLRLPGDAAPAAAPFVPQPVSVPSSMVPQATAVAPPQGGRAAQPHGAAFVYFPAEHRRGPRRRAPPKAWRLAPDHITPSLRGELLQVLWPEDRQWWPALVVDVNPAAGSASFVYETGEREDGVRLAHLVSNSHVAWLNAETAERRGAGPAPAMGGRKRMAGQEPPSRQASAAAPVLASYIDAGDGMELDGEEAVLNKLKGVTKRQRAAAAKQAAKQAAAAAPAAPPPAATVSGAGAAPTPAFSADGPALSDPFVPSLGGLAMPSFLPDSSLELGMGSGSMLGGMESSMLPGGMSSGRAPYQPPRMLPVAPPAPAPAPVPPPPPPTTTTSAPTPIVRHLLQMGASVLGLGVMLHINGITLPATISGTRPAQEALILEVRGRTVVVRSQDEGVRFGLSLVRQQPQLQQPLL